MYNDLRALFRMVDQGDDALGVAEYNGGLFSARRHPWFEGRFVPDDLLAPALDYLSRVGGSFVDYRQLSVRHLGTIYERLLDFRLAQANGLLELVPAPGRRESGSYFTPELIVDRIVERALDPLLADRSRHARAHGLRGPDALDCFLGLRVLDPAMGSGHFLVAAAGWMSQHIATDPAYDGALSLEEIQRLVVERCLYGVDLNPMAVELARLSLWLATARRDEPLTFLGNLRAGNSLVGARVSDLLAGGHTVFGDRLASEAESLLARVGELDRRSSRTGDAVHEKERIAATVESLREPLEAYADATIGSALAAEVGRPFHWELEFPEVFLTVDGRPRHDGGFDGVVGNPPYVRIQALGRRLADYCRARYATASGSFDVYVPFVERAVGLLAPWGRLGFIVPNKILKVEYGQRLRERLARHELVEEIVDFGDAQLFVGATNYTCILVLAGGGAEKLRYRKVGSSATAVASALLSLDSVEAESYPFADLGSRPWALATGERARLARALGKDAASLAEVTKQIFQGLITSADPIYIVEDRGRRGGRRVVYSKASGREFELEPDLLHPLASGVDVDRYACRPLPHLLLFPYRARQVGVSLVSLDELRALPATEAYLRSHEAELRARERGKMDHQRWYGFGRTQSLALHDIPKLGVAATVRRLEVAADPGGAIYFHNVRVNGILVRPDGPSIWSLLVLLNSPLLDWLFKLGAAEHANGYYAANKQFIAQLPVRIPSSSEAATLDRLGQRLHATATAIGRERKGFLDWLAGAVGSPPAAVARATRLGGYERLTGEELLALVRSPAQPATTGRAFREQLFHEHGEATQRLQALATALAVDDRAASEAVYDLYRVGEAGRRVIERDS